MCGKALKPTLPIGKNVEDNTMGNPQLTNEELAWLAGVIDGEGNLDLNKRYGLHRQGKGTWNWNRPRIIIGSTDARLIAKVSEIYAKIGCKFWYSTLKRYEEHHKPCLLIITIGIRNVFKVLIRVKDYLTVKKNQAELLIRYCLWRQEAFSSSSKEDWSRGHELVPQITQAVQDLKNDVPDIFKLSRKANQPIQLGSSETNTCDTVKEITVKIESVLHGNMQR